MIKIGRPNVIELPEPTWEALEEFLADPMISAFLDDRTKDVIREKSKGQLISREEYEAKKRLENEQ